MIRKTLAVGIILLFIVSSVTPMVIGYKKEASERDILLEQLKFMCATTNGDDGMYEYYKDELLNNDYFEDNDVEIVEPVEKMIPGELPLPFTTGPMDSAWPMKSHDTHHTSQSPYSTAGSPDLEEKWRFFCGKVDGSPVIGEDGTIYF